MNKQTLYDSLTDAVGMLLQRQIAVATRRNPIENSGTPAELILRHAREHVRREIPALIRGGAHTANDHHFVRDACACGTDYSRPCR